MDLSRSHFYFIGIGGIGMSGLAELLNGMGAKVSGSDIAKNAQTERLISLGVTIYPRHSSENIADADVVVYSSAIPAGNPEIVEARERRIPIIPRAEALAEVMRMKRAIAVAGTHGKTTTSSLIGSVFIKGDLDPTIVVGGRFHMIGSTSRLGKGSWCIAEADESDGSFSKLNPEIAVITNIDSDHLDHFGSFENIKLAFRQFAERVPFYGEVIACGDDPVVREVLTDYPKKVTYYGFESNNDYVISYENGISQIESDGVKYQLSLPGRHNCLNSCAAYICGIRAGLSPSVIARGLSEFDGIDRRFQKRGTVNGALVIDDYGHHPTEVTAVIAAAKEAYPGKKIKLIFQPHRFSRTRECWDDFKSCLGLADQVYLLDIHAAGEDPIENITSKQLAAEIEACEYSGEMQDLTQELKRSLNLETLLLVMGAGSVSQQLGKFLEHNGDS